MADEERGAPSGNDGQDQVERMLERGVILVAKGMVTLAVAALVYGCLVIAFFLCCGVGAGSYVDPKRSPLGAALTIAVIWPLMGFLCFGLQGDPSGALSWSREVREICLGRSPSSGRIVNAGAEARVRPNKGMKLTSVERIGRSQLIPSVLLLLVGRRSGSQPGRGHGAQVRDPTHRLRRPQRLDGCHRLRKGVAPW